MSPILHQPEPEQPRVGPVDGDRPTYLDAAMAALADAGTDGWILARVRAARDDLVELRAKVAAHQPAPEQPREMAPDDGYAPAGCVELDGVLYCVAHDGIIDELSCRQNRDGDPCCDQWDEYDDVCRMVPLFIRVEEDDCG